MAGLNRGLMILITLLAIGAAVLSFLLFQKRAEFADRASLLAKTTADMVKALDEESNTSVSRKVTFTPANPELGIEESGTLSALDFHNDRVSGSKDFEASLAAATDLAATINKQRNDLAQTLDEVAYALEISDGELSVGDLKNAGEPDRYLTASQKIKSLAEATQERTEAMINALSVSSSVLGHSLEKTMFTTRDSKTDEDGNVTMTSFKHAPQLTDFNKAVADMNQRCQDYRDTLVQAVESVQAFDWRTDSDQISNEFGYARALTNLNADFAEINRKLIQAKEDRAALLEKVKSETELREKLAQAKEKQAALQAKADELARSLDSKQMSYNITPSKNATGKVDVDENLRGHVVQVNPEWNYVILDLGENDVHENLPLVVSRGEEYIGRVMVSKVAKNICVADMDSKLMTKPIEEGDVVFLPKNF